MYETYMVPDNTEPLYFPLIYPAIICKKVQKDLGEFEYCDNIQADSVLFRSLACPKMSSLACQLDATPKACILHLK